MMTKEKSLYQVKLIIECLPREEYELIPQDIIEYIENNFEYDENITIDPSIPLENQIIDEKSYELLDKIIKSAEINKKEKENIVKYTESENNESDDLRKENIELKNIIDMLKKENDKITKAKGLVVEYKEALRQKDIEIAKLKENNAYLCKYIEKIPKIVRMIFIRNADIKLLNGDNKN